MFIPGGEEVCTDAEEVTMAKFTYTEDKFSVNGKCSYGKICAKYYRKFRNAKLRIIVLQV